MFPVPDVPKPTLEVDDQSKVMPEVGLEKLMAVAEAVLQYTALETLFTLGEGLTVTVNVLVAPTQVLAMGVTDTVAVTAASLSMVV